MSAWFLDSELSTCFIIFWLNLQLNCIYNLQQIELAYIMLKPFKTYAVG